MEKIKNGIETFNIYNKLYQPKFNLGDIVKFITASNDDDSKYIVYGYIIDIGNNIKYRLTKNGNITTVDFYEIELY